MEEFKMAKFKMVTIIKLSQNQWVKFFVQMVRNQSWQVGVCLRGKTKMADSKMAKFKLAEFKMAAIIKLSQNELVWVRDRVEGECFWVNLREEKRSLNSNMAEV